MERTAIDSSLLTSVGFEADYTIPGKGPLDPLGNLEVEFKSDGSVWRYPGIDKSLYDQMMQAESVGSFFMKKIRPTYVGEIVNE